MFSREQGIIIAKSRLGGGALNRLGENGAWSLEDLKIEFEAPYRHQSGAESPERHCDLAAFRGGDRRGDSGRGLALTCRAGCRSMARASKCKSARTFERPAEHTGVLFPFLA